MNNQTKPVVLVILDGWGEWQETRGNSLCLAKLPTIGHLDAHYPKLLLEASGEAVGLPTGQMGNSEVGHLTLGSGQVIYQQLPSINLAMADGTFVKNRVLLEAMEWAKEHNSKLHLLGLASPGGVHSHQNHLLGLLRMAKEQGLTEVFIQAITDGRDTPPKSAKEYLSQVIKATEDLGVGKISSVIGRHWAMDRNTNWDRTEKAFLALTGGVGQKTENLFQAIDQQYQNNVVDEYLEPIIITEAGSPLGLIENNDAVIFFNFRKDRARQLTKAFVSPDFQNFNVKNRPAPLKFVTFTEYEPGLPVAVVFPEPVFTVSLGELLSQADRQQLRMAETEKYAHVTYFFNGGLEQPFSGEDRILVDSIRTSTYATVPMMSAEELTRKLELAIKEKKYDFILINYANPDMVGHTGKLAAAIKAVEVVDQCLTRIISLVQQLGSTLLITADHGNIEQMIHLHSGEEHTEHTTNLVPAWLIGPDNFLPFKPAAQILQSSGLIADVPATILELLNMDRPEGMTGRSLLPLFKSK